MSTQPETPQQRLWMLAHEVNVLERAAEMLERAGTSAQRLAAVECRVLAANRTEAAEQVRAEIRTATRARMAASRAKRLERHESCLDHPCGPTCPHQRYHEQP